MTSKLITTELQLKGILLKEVLGKFLPLNVIE